MGDEATRRMNYTLELSNDEGERLVSALRKNNIYGDGEALGVIVEAIRGGRLTVLPTAFKGTRYHADAQSAHEGYREVVLISELND
jgi:hypothetical protein